MLKIKKITNVISNLDSKTGGGAAERVYQISKNLSLLGYEICILTTNYQLKENRIIDLFPAKVIALKNFFNINFIPFPNIYKIYLVIKESDFINLFNHWSVINVYAFIFIKLLKKPYSVTPMGALPIFGRAQFIKRVFNLILGKKIIKNANVHIATSENEYYQYSEYGIQGDQVSFIPNGIDADYYSSEGSFNCTLALPKYYVLFVGRLNKIKGVDLLITAFYQISQKYSDLKLVIAGPDEGCRRTLLDMVRIYGIDEKVLFLGFVDEFKKKQIIKSSLFVAIPSRQDSMPLVILEAGISAKPILITNVAGFNQIAEIGAGVSVDPSVEDIKSGMINILDNLQYFSEEAVKFQNYIRIHYSWLDLARKHQNFLDKN